MLAAHRRIIAQLTGTIVLMLLSILQLGSQSNSPTVVISVVPAWGQDGMLTGYLYGTTSQQVGVYAFEFIPDAGWYSLSNCSAIPIQSTGQFSVNATSGIMGRYATRFSVYVVPSSLPIPCGQGTGTIPFIVQQNALSHVSLPRIAQYGTLAFGGLTWFIKTAPVQVSPGPQFFTPQNAFVDAQGQLHLKITQCADSWCAAEIFTTQTVGYGAYSFTINSTLNNLDPNVTLGLFPWDAQAGDINNREWDIEFSRWGNAGASANAQYVVQPYQGPNNIFKFLMSPSSVSSHTVNWLPGQVQFKSSSASGIISQWTYPGSPLPAPTPGDGRLHMNFYINSGSAPAVPINQEIIISGFQYTPTGGQIGFSRTSDNTAFLSSTYNVPLNVTSSACSGTVESDSPWLSVVGPSTIAGNGAIQYMVQDNIGVARTGNLILQSTNCNAALGGQVLTVSQAGFVCSPTFAVGSTNIGFLQSIRSILIRGSSSACSWTVSSFSPWLTIVSSPSGSGDGNIQVSAGANTGSALRQGLLGLDNGQQHWVYQDAASSMLALSPLVATQCGSQPPQFGVSWISPGNVEIHLGSLSGQLVGQFAPTGSTILPPVSDGTVVYMVTPGSSQPLASAVVSVLQSNCASPSISPRGIVNAASFGTISVAPGSLATVFGTNLSSATASANVTPYPTSLGGISVSLSGELCPISYVSPTQVNFVIPSDAPAGRYLLTVNGATSDLLVTAVSPGIFTLNGNGAGVPLASVLAVAADGTTTTLSPYQCSSSGCAIAPMKLPPNVTTVYIVLYTTGVRNVKGIAASVGSVAAEVVYFGAIPVYPGVDQVNLRVSNVGSLSGHQSLILLTDGIFSNSVDLLFQ
jgi:uncharacterized protein (TIGR03437 family)